MTYSLHKNSCKLLLQKEKPGQFFQGTFQKQPLTDFLRNRSSKISRILQENTCVETLFKKETIRKRLQQKCFPVKIANFIRTPFFTKHLRSHLALLIFYLVLHLLWCWKVAWEYTWTQLICFYFVSKAKNGSINWAINCLKLKMTPLKKLP